MQFFNQTATRAFAATALLIVPIGMSASRANATVKPITSSNLVYNGDFELGNTGFTSGYSYYANGSSNDGSGHDYYQIGTNADDDNNRWYNPGDHTTGTGNFMYVDGSTTANTPVWEQTINVKQGVTYNVSGYFASLYPVSDPLINFTIGGNNAGSQLDLNNAGNWQQESFLWKATSNVLNLGIVDHNLDAGGNDFAIDDLSVKPVPESSTFILFGVLAAAGVVLLRKRSAKSAA